MKVRLLPLSILLPFLCSLAPASYGQELDSFRKASAREDTTIFSPLDLPTPNRIRTASGAPGPDYWQQRVDYSIQASLDPETRTVTATEHVTYHNASPDALEYIWLNVEQNAFREDSIAAKVGTTTAIGMSQAEGEGTTIHSITSGGQPLEIHVYDTLARVEMPTPIAADGGIFSFDVSWEFTIPEKVFRRFGIREFEQGKMYEIAQWFPAVAVYDDVYGWNTLPYIGTGEFYQNFGTYDVELTVPRNMVVVATGELQNARDVYTQTQLDRLTQARQSRDTVLIITPEEVGTPESRPAGDGPLTWRFHAENVRTVAWACSDAAILDAASEDGVLFQSFYPKEGLPVWGEATQMLRAAVANYNKRWFHYPYPVATNVLGAEGGMEYPMIIFCRGRNERGVFGVTAHEIGHNWFPMTVNTDERRHAWMDEGFNTFINTYAGEDWFDDDSAHRSDPGSFGSAMRAENMLPIDTKPDMLPGYLLGQLEYAKTGVGLRILRDSILGPERFDYAFRTYIRRWAFKSPQPADFFRTMEDAAGADLAWFWRGWFLETGTLDQAVVKVRQPSKKRGPRITFENRGRLVMPLHYRVTREDGSVDEHRIPVELWFHLNRITDRIDGLSPVVKVEIDPDNEFPDVDRDNNVWPEVAEDADAEEEPHAEHGEDEHGHEHPHEKDGGHGD
ncbi:MAG TPA: M1 family peptidase [Planctomycetes bacterium]|nr:M1 family peptidase [Planctomycetota bacterium]